MKNFTVETRDGSFGVTIESVRRENGMWEDTVYAIALGRVQHKRLRYIFRASWIKTCKGLMMHSLEFKKEERGKLYIPPRGLVGRLEDKVARLLIEVIDGRINELNEKIFDLDCKINQQTA